MPGSTLSANEQTTMGAAFRRVAESRPDREALVCGETRLTYGQLLERIATLAHGLGRLGLKKGDRIALLLPPGPEFVVLFFAIAELGAIVVPLSPQSRRRSLQAVLGDAEPFALVTARPLQEGVLDACRDCPSVFQRGSSLMRAFRSHNATSSAAIAAVAWPRFPPLNT